MSWKALKDTNEMCSRPLGILKYSLNRLIQYGRRIGKKVHWLPFIRQNKALYKVEWRNFFFLRATCQCYLIICSYFNEDEGDWRSRYSAC